MVNSPVVTMAHRAPPALCSLPPAFTPDILLLTHPTLATPASWMVFQLGSHIPASGPLHCYSLSLEHSSPDTT